MNEEEYSYERLEVLKKVDRFTLKDGRAIQDSTVVVQGVYSKIRALVDKAKTASGGAITLNATAANDQMSKTSDGKYYQTAIIMKYLQQNKNTSTSLLLKRFTDKQSGKVSEARREIQRRFDYLDWNVQKRILLYFLDSGKSDRMWASGSLR